MRFAHTTAEEQNATGATHRLDLSYLDIPSGIANAAAQTWNVAPLPKLKVSDIVRVVSVHLTVPFENTADAAFNDSTLSLGLVTGGVAALIAAFQANVNGTEVIDSIPGVGNVKNATADNQVTVTLNSMTAKSLSNLNKGYFYALFEILHQGGASIIKQTAVSGDGYT